MYFGPQRKNIRLKGYDYLSFGYYFVTICTKNSEYFFGNVKNNIMGLSEIGCIAAKYWQEIPLHFKFVKLDEWVIMPNHVHGVLFLKNGYDVYYCRDAINRVPTNRVPTNGGVTGKHNPMGKKILGEIIRWFKGRCSFEIHKKYDQYFLWQTRFYDHIIRNNKSLNRIREYIQCNPEKWWRGRNNIKNLFM